MTNSDLFLASLMSRFWEFSTTCLKVLATAAASDAAGKAAVGRSNGLDEDGLFSVRLRVGIV